MDDRLDQLAMRIFVQMAAQHAVRHGMHGSRGEASALARESFKLAEAFAEECAARSNRDDAVRTEDTGSATAPV